MENNRYYKVEENTIDLTTITTYGMVVQDSDGMPLGVNIQTVIKIGESINCTSNFIKDAEIKAWRVIDNSDEVVECSLGDDIKYVEYKVIYELVYYSDIANFEFGKISDARHNIVDNSYAIEQKNKEDALYYLKNIATQIKNLDDNLQNIAQHLPDSYDDSSLVSSIDSLVNVVSNSLEGK